MDYHGGITIENVNHVNDDVKLVVNKGIIELDSSCTDGNIVMFGDVETIRNDNGTTVQDYTTAPTEQQLLQAGANDRRYTNEVANTITIYEKDNVTPKKVFDYTENGSGEIIEITPQ